jgi:hypothetical protein
MRIPYLQAPGLDFQKRRRRTRPVSCGDEKVQMRTQLKFGQVDPEVCETQMITQPVFRAALNLRGKWRGIDGLSPDDRHINGLEWI